MSISLSVSVMEACDAARSLSPLSNGVLIGARDAAPPVSPLLITLLIGDSRCALIFTDTRHLLPDWLIEDRRGVFISLWQHLVKFTNNNRYSITRTTMTNLTRLQWPLFIWSFIYFCFCFLVWGHFGWITVSILQYSLQNKQNLYYCFPNIVLVTDKLIRWYMDQLTR